MNDSEAESRAGLYSRLNWALSGIKAATVLVGLIAVLLAFAAPASALPAICDEYPDLPVCSENTGGGGGGDGSGDDVGSGEAFGGPGLPVGSGEASGGPGLPVGSGEASGGPGLPVGRSTTGGGNDPGTGSVGSANSAGGTGSGAELPFTGYPLTTLLLLMLLLLALGLAIRAGVAIHHRLGRRGREAATLPPPA